MSIEAALHNQPGIPEVNQSADFEYRLLTGHARTDGSFKTTEQLHSEYVHLTDNLIHKMVDGVQVVDPTTAERVIEPVDTVVWLDKSARPLAWLTKDLWPLLAADKNGQTPPMPAFKFVNIDRNQWTSSIDPEGRGRSDVSGIDQSIIRSLRSVFLANPNDRQQGLTEQVDTAPTQLDGKTVLIVDEVMASGRTLDYAERFFARAFPEAKIAGAHWMGKTITTKLGATGNADIPVWYSDTTSLGRGVGNRNVDLSLSSANPVQRLGAWFLSTALREPDPLSKELRTELHQLAEDAKAGKVFIDPSWERDAADFDDRAVRLNHLANLEEYVEQRRLLATS